MKATSELSLYPLHQCKILHLVRHAEGIHNVDGVDKKSLDMVDPCLSRLGWEQAVTLRNQVRASALQRKIELVITSPLLRTLQTAAVIFGGDYYKNEADASQPLMLQNERNNHATILSKNCPTFIAHELCRERLGVNTCDKRRRISEHRSLFPAIDFSLIETDEDMLWKPDVRESNEELSARGMKFMNWLWTRKEKEIAIVTHSALLFQTLPALVYDCHPSTQNEICEFFANAELRSVVLMNKSLIGGDVAKTNYPGKSPFALYLTSDQAAANQENGEEK